MRERQIIVRLKSGELEPHEEHICRTSVQGDCTKRRHSVQPGKVLEACSQFSGRWWGARGHPMGAESSRQGGRYRSELLKEGYTGLGTLQGEL